MCELKRKMRGKKKRRSGLGVKREKIIIKKYYRKNRLEVKLKKKVEKKPDRRNEAKV